MIESCHCRGDSGGDFCACATRFFEAQPKERVWRVSLPDDIRHRTAVSNVLVALELKACLSGGFKETRA